VPICLGPEQSNSGIAKYLADALEGVMKFVAGIGRNNNAGEKRQRARRRL